jgi:integrase/recombinase XerD
MHRVIAWRIVKRCMADAPIRGPQVTCKGLRHGYGIAAAERSIPANLMRRWMGHASLSTTLLYVEAVGAEERAFAARLWRARR